MRSANVVPLALLLLHPRPAPAAVFSIPLTIAPASTLPLYLALVGIGTPPQVRTLALDTSSSIAFTSCVGCVGCPAGRPLFNPNASSTARRVPCGDALCNARVCSPGQPCPVVQTYAEGSTMSGTLLTDAFFGALQPAAPAPLLPFACAVHEGGLFSVVAEDGVLGLGAARAYNGTFLPALLAAGVLDSEAFTLCLALQGAPSTLLLGAARSGGADFAWAPLAAQASLYPGFYAPTVTDLLLEGEGVCGGAPCPGLNAPFAMIDTGAFTYVPSTAFSSLLSSAQAWCEAAPAERCLGTRAVIAGEVLCYSTLQPTTFPTATLALLSAAGGRAVSVTFPVFSSRPWADLCWSVYDNGRAGTVIGINALANKTLVFDLAGGRLGVGADTGVCAAEPPSATASASASPAATPSAGASKGASQTPTPSPTASPSVAPSGARTASCALTASAAAPAPAPPAARDGGLAPGAVAALCVLGAAAACGAAGLLWRAALRRGTGKGAGGGEVGGSDVVARPNPASAASRRIVAGDSLSVWQTAAEGGAGSAAAAARAEALREVLLLRGDDPLPPRPSEI